MEELQTPGGRVMGSEKDLDDNRGRWGLIWDGKEIVEKVLHALDPLRECRELANWYGRRFYFIANPLMLAFDMRNGLDVLNMNEKVSEHIITKPHVRVGLGTRDGTQDWKHQKYLVKWRETFLELWETSTSFNWPVLPLLKVYEYISCDINVTNTNSGG